MADSLAFQTVCAALEAGSTLDRLEARGTVRLALRQSGFEARSVTARQLAVVVERVLPEELRARGVEITICKDLSNALCELSDDPAAQCESPEDLFVRLGE